MANSERHLRSRGKYYYAHIAVPKPLQKVYGCAILEKALKTSDHAEALIARDLWLAEVRQQFMDHQRGIIDTPPHLKIKRAVEVQRVFEAALENPGEAESVIGLQALQTYLSDKGAVEKEVIAGAAAHAWELWKAGHRPAPPPATQTPLLEPLERWGDAKPRTIKERRQVVHRFAVWASAKGLDTFEAVTRKCAAEYIAEGLTGLSARSVGKHCVILSGYWRWSIDTGTYEGANPWDRQPRPKVQPTVKRAWRDDELAILLDGNPGEPLRDAIMIAACAGLRIEEICQLRVSDCTDGAFNVRSGKTAAARREIPVHSGLSAMVEARCEGREPGEYLLDELDEPRGDLERSHGLSIAFKDYRRSVGLDDPATDFHSLRRRFADVATKALERGNCGFGLWAMQEVLGHSRKGVTAGYAGPRGIDAKRAVVESVRLPA